MCKSSADYHKCVGKTGQRVDFSSSEDTVRYLCVCGMDSTGAVLVADQGNRNFKVHMSDDQWSVVSMEPLPSHRPLDVLCDADTGNVWTLTCCNGCFLTKLDKLQ